MKSHLTFTCKKHIITVNHSSLGYIYSQLGVIHCSRLLEKGQVKISFYKLDAK
jgi:hypothetical protein